MIKLKMIELLFMLGMNSISSPQQPSFPLGATDSSDSVAMADEQGNCGGVLSYDPESKAKINSTLTTSAAAGGCPMPIGYSQPGSWYILNGWYDPKQKSISKEVALAQCGTNFIFNPNLTSKANASPLCVKAAALIASTNKTSVIADNSKISAYFDLNSWMNLYAIWKSTGPGGLGCCLTSQSYNQACASAEANGSTTVTIPFNVDKPSLIKITESLGFAAGCNVEIPLNFYLNWKILVPGEFGQTVVYEGILNQDEGGVGYLEGLMLPGKYLLLLHFQAGDFAKVFDDCNGGSGPIKNCQSNKAGEFEIVFEEVN